MDERMMQGLRIVLLIGIVASTGCDNEPSPKPQTLPAESAVTTQPTKMVRIVFLGDSLTAGLGLEQDQAFPALIGETLKRENVSATIVNAGVSGDTTAGGLRRVEWLLKQKPDILVVGLGANDGLRATDVKASEQNLREIVTKARSAGSQVLLLGMLIPPNYGPEYTAAFKEVYPRIAKEMTVPLVPFVLEGVGGVPAMNQPDGIHPTAEGQKVVAENVLKELRMMVRTIEPRTK
jgi:acyl-CoA thioesterase-1